MSSLVFPQVVSVLRRDVDGLQESRVGCAVGRPPGVPRSEDRERGFWPSTARPPSRPASSLMMRPRSSDRPRPRVGGAPPRSRRCSCALECPALVRLAAGSALFWCRRGAVSASGVQNGGDQPGQHAARHRKPTGSTAETQRKHHVIAWFLGDTQATEALIPSVLDTSGPTTPSTDPPVHRPHRKTTGPLGTTHRDPRTSL